VPFLPVHLPGGSRQVGLVEAVLPRPHSLGDLETSSPRSSVLQELRGLVIPEEEVPTAGVDARQSEVGFLKFPEPVARHAGELDGRSIAFGHSTVLRLSGSSTTTGGGLEWAFVIGPACAVRST
jgi:hypothetical protein